MDLSKLDDNDLEALAAGDMSRMSDAGLQMVAGAQEAPAASAGAPKKAPRSVQALSAAERFLQGLRDPFDAAEQMAVRGNRWLVDKGVPGARPLPAEAGKAVDERQARFAAGKPEGVDWARMVGNFASPPNLALMAVPGATVPRAAAIGAASGVLTPTAGGEDFLADKGKQAMAGAAGGGAMSAITRGLSRVVAPNASRNPDLARLRGEGVEPTIGQAVGGTTGKVEQAMTSIPILGDAIARQKGRARDQFNRAALRRVTDPLRVPPVAGVGTDGVRQAGDAASAVYDQARSLGTPRLDRAGVQDIRRVLNAPLGTRESDELARIFGRVQENITPGGRMRDFKSVDSVLGTEARRFQGSPDAFQQRLGEQVGNLQDAITNSVMRRNPQAQILREQADEAYANLVRVEGAVNKADRSGGVFTPGQLKSSVRIADPRVRHRGTARGEALMQDLADSGQRVLGDTVPDSGTAGRLGWAALAGGGGFGMAVDPVSTAGVIAALGAGAMAYTPAVQRMLVAAVASRGPGWQQAAEFLRTAGAHAAAPAGRAAASFFEDDYLEY